MELALKDLEKHSILFIGKQISLTPENPGPVLIDIDSLTEKEAKQVLFNVRMGILSTEYDTALLEERLGLNKVEEPSQDQISTPKEATPLTSPRKREVRLKKILAKKINVIKKEASNLSVSELRELIELERTYKNRKSLLPFLVEMYGSHTDEVAQNLKAIEDNSEKQGLSPQTFLDDLPDVVESEGKEVEIPLSD